MAQKDEFPYNVRVRTKDDNDLPHSGVPTTGPDLVGEIKK